MSTGFRVEASRKLLGQACPVASESSGSMQAAASRASAARIPGPPALVTMPTLRPRGNGWLASKDATANISSMVLVRITPACSKRASTATSELASAPVWLWPPAARR